MTAKERIERAWSNVNSLARSSDYCNESDRSDIEFIESIVLKEIPIKPIVDGYKLICGCCHEPMNIGFCFCKNRKRGHYIVRTDCHSNYCNNCGRKIDWDKGGTANVD